MTKETKRFILAFLILIFLAFAAVGDKKPGPPENYKTESKEIVQSSTPTPTTTVEPTPEPTPYIETEDDYKAKCVEMYYDEVFFGDEDLENTYVKLRLMLSEKFFFTSNDMLSSTLQEYDKEYNLNRDFYKCCVLRDGTTSYMGRQINMWFSDDNGLNPSDYKVGEKITVYAKVIGWSNNSWDGYNSVTIIPKYIEK